MTIKIVPNPVSNTHWLLALHEQIPLSQVLTLLRMNSFKGHEIEWNAEKQEWVCIRCFLTSDHSTRADAEMELSYFECIPAEKPEEPASQ